MINCPTCHAALPDATTCCSSCGADSTSTGSTQRPNPSAEPDIATLWQAIANAGIRVRPDYTAPQRWVSATRWHQYGPFDTQAQALQAAIHGLITQLEDREQAIEAMKWRNPEEWLRQLFRLD